jgi:hypothetical protein
MGLRPTKVHKDAQWGGPPGPRGSPWTRSLALDHMPIRPTWASAADQGVRPTWRLQRSWCLFRSAYARVRKRYLRRGAAQGLLPPARELASRILEIPSGLSSQYNRTRRIARPRP